MYSSLSEHQSAYIFWGNVRGTPLPVAKENGEISTAIRPTFAENLRYAIAYQFNHQYWRYFLWNFVGRQDDVLNQSGSAMHGNVLSGFDTLDGLFLGSQRELPKSLRHATGRAPLYCLPLLLGLLGFGFLFFRSPRYTLILTSLFFMTGLAIVFYLNQTPLQPRERDYTFLGSFMVFSIWIGFGVLALYELLRRGKFAYYLRWSVLLCAEVVPAADIEGGKGQEPTWKHNGSCLTCFACYHHCPQHAIEFGRQTKKKGQYWYGRNQ